MRSSPDFEFPPEQTRVLHRARRLEWITLIYLLSVVVLMYFVLGSSQAMKSAWLEDMLSLIPPIVFLVASRVAVWPSNDRFPYGYHRAVSIAFLCASLALFGMGAFLLGDAAVKLMTREHPTIGSVHLFGHTIWLGWLMIPTLIYSGAPAVVLGRMKLPLAEKIHDKVLFADADMNKADWMTAAAALVGVMGIGLGFWWADSVAAGFISLSILRDGTHNLRAVVTDLMDERPKTVSREEPDSLPDRLREAVERLGWVEAAEVRLREEGHVYFGEVFVHPSEGSLDYDRCLEITSLASNMDWRLHDLTVSLLSPDELREIRGGASKTPSGE